MSRYFVSSSFSNGKVDMGKVKLLEGVTSFSQLVKECIADPVMHSLTRAQFLALPKKDSSAPNDQSRAKRVSYIVPGSYELDEVPRDGANIPTACNLVILDIDEGRNSNYPARRFVDDTQQLQALLSPYAFVAYHTASSTAEAPKIRVIVSANALTPADYPRAVHYVAHKLGLNEGDFDKVSVEVTRAMYRPVAYRGEQVDPILEAAPEGQSLSEIDLSDTELPQVQSRSRRGAGDSDDIEFLKAPLDGFTIADAVEALGFIDADCGYNQWLEICMALKHQFPREPEATQALEAFDMWSASAKSKYEGREVTAEKWGAVNVTARGRAPRTIRSIIFFAEEAGWSSSAFSKRSYQLLVDWLGSDARSADELIAEGLKKIAGAHLESPVERDVLVNLLSKRLAALKRPVGKTVLKKQLDSLTRALKVQQEQSVTSLPESQLPSWARGIVYVSDTNEFYQRISDKTWSPDTLCSTFNVFLNPSAETGKAAVEAKDYLLNIAKVPRVSNYQYAPKHFDQAVVKHRSKKFINTYQPSYPEADRSDIAAGEVLHNHIRNLVREEVYQHVLIDFLAYHVQNPGAKIRWAVLLQGGQGCGKTAIFEAMQGVLGAENAKPINAETLMESRFTKWASGAQLRAIEEVRVVGENRHAVMNKLKPYITNDTISVEKKGKDETEIPNCTNYIMFTNHHDALAVQDGDRRYFILQSQLQVREQIAALGGDYFEKLFHVIKFRAAGLRAWLEGWSIGKDFNPDGHAPETPYFRDMVDAAASPLAQSIRETMADGEHPLVRLDLSSSRCIAEIMRTLGMQASPNAIGGILRELGYKKAGRTQLGDDNHNIWIKHNSALDWQTLAKERFNRIGAAHFEDESLDLL